MNLARFSQSLIAVALTLASATAPAAGPGRAAPNCQVAPIEGGPVLNLKDFKGQVVYLDFWASWCPTCIQSFGYMDELHRDLEAQGLKVVALNLDDTVEDAKAFLAQKPVKFKVYRDAGGQCPDAFGVKAMPASYLIDRQGVIREVKLGFRPGEAQRLRATVEKLVGSVAQASNTHTHE